MTGKDLVACLVGVTDCVEADMFDEWKIGCVDTVFYFAV